MISPGALLTAAVLTAGVPAPPAPAAPSHPAGQPRILTLTRPGLSDTAVRYGPGGMRLAPGSSYGYTVRSPLVLAAATGRVSARVEATTPPGSAVLVEVRGDRRDGRWGEWRDVGPRPAVLDLPGSRLQLRVSLWRSSSGRGPAASAVRLRPVPGGAAGTRAPGAALGYRVFATRIGLVGEQTANGHIITANDHFVALPSRRGLSPRAAGDYTVRVCAANRCEYAPVWDVGPWNTRDDYWNPPATRQMWSDLPRGRPQAQAAHQNGYNGGRDQFGRRVSNPAGIDLADGMFRDGLGLRDNTWVTVTYLWTGDRRFTGTVQRHLNVRTGPGRGYPIVGLAAVHARVSVECQVTGDDVRGPFGRSRLWDRIGPGHFVSDAYVDTGSPNQVAPAC